MVCEGYLNLIFHFIILFFWSNTKSQNYPRGKETLGFFDIGSTKSWFYNSQKPNDFVSFGTQKYNSWFTSFSKVNLSESRRSSRLKKPTPRKSESAKEVFDDGHNDQELKFEVGIATNPDLKMKTKKPRDPLKIKIPKTRVVHPCEVCQKVFHAKKG